MSAAVWFAMLLLLLATGFLDINQIRGAEPFPETRTGIGQRPGARQDRPDPRAQAQHFAHEAAHKGEQR